MRTPNLRLKVKLELPYDIDFEKEYRVEATDEDSLFLYGILPLTEEEYNSIVNIQKYFDISSILSAHANSNDETSYILVGYVSKTRNLKHPRFKWLCNHAPAESIIRFQIFFKDKESREFITRSCRVNMSCY